MGGAAVGSTAGIYANNNNKPKLRLSEAKADDNEDNTGGFNYCWMHDITYLTADICINNKNVSGDENKYSTGGFKHCWENYNLAQPQQGQQSMIYYVGEEKNDHGDDFGWED